MTHLIVSISAVLPVFLIIGLGFLLKTKKVIDERFIQVAMKLVFNISLPGMLFLKVSQSDLSTITDGDSIRFTAFVLISTLICTYVATFIGRGLDSKSKGTFIQGVFRSNYIIIGYSVLENIFGDAVIGRMALLVMTVVPLYNILAVLVLEKKSERVMSNNLLSTAKKIVTNPLIIGIVAGLFIAAMGITIPKAINNTISLLGQIGTPLGLLGIGAFFSAKELGEIKTAVLAVVLKLILFPIIVLGAAYAIGFAYMDLVVIFVLFGSPTAITSFIMASAYDGNSRLAANIVIISTLASLATLVTGLTLLSYIA